MCNIRGGATFHGDAILSETHIKHTANTRQIRIKHQQHIKATIQIVCTAERVENRFLKQFVSDATRA